MLQPVQGVARLCCAQAVVLYVSNMMLCPAPAEWTSYSRLFTRVGAAAAATPSMSCECTSTLMFHTHVGGCVAICVCMYVCVYACRHNDTQTPVRTLWDAMDSTYDSLYNKVHSLCFACGRCVLCLHAHVCHGSSASSDTASCALVCPRPFSTARSVESPMATGHCCALVNADAPVSSDAPINTVAAAHC